MNIIKWIKGKIKQREVKNLIPDKDFEFKQNYYGDINILEGFKFTYCNNYTDRYYHEYKDKISFLSCAITLPNNSKILLDALELMYFHYYYYKITDKYNYNNLYYHIQDEYFTLYLRGNINYYNNLCDLIHNNLITRYIRNNIFIDDKPIETPNEFLNNMYNSITNPDKEIDILFIEDNIEYHKIKPVIGLSLHKNCNNINIQDKIVYEINNRNILYCELDRFTEEEIKYIKNTARHGNKLPENIHININVDIDFDDIDEIIEDYINK